ncbi:MAG: dienelactone hydrolase family protein [Actinobacteria bacterium]|nr:dienelactone hydrolase family protein [Actinomycetota bacterium]
MIVISGWWGLVHICEVVVGSVRSGFTALAPDLYRGRTTDRARRGGKLMSHIWTVPPKT